MGWIDIASILFAATAANHLGLISAIERVIGLRLPIVNCPKCLACWATFAYCFSSETLEIGLAAILALSFLNAYMAIWLELGMGYIDTLYYRIYDTIYPTAEDNETATDTDEGGAAGGVS